MDYLDIKQVEQILGWSYPTALEWAAKQGERQGRKWVVNPSVVDAVIREREAQVFQMRQRYNSALSRE